MSFVERLRILIDVDSKGATTGLGGFRRSVADADGMTGKFKAGANSAMQSVKANAGLLAVSAGAALVTFGVKALAAFQGAAKGAVDFGKATGLSTEAASRWIAVADDYQVSSATLQTAMAKAARSGLDFVDVMERINNAAPADRARVSFELLGKAAQGIAPLLGKTRAEYEKMLATVGEGQVITEREAAKAEKMRLAQDKLADAMERITMATGEFVAELAPMIEQVAESAEVVIDLADKLGGLKTAMDLFTNPVGSIFDGTARDALLELEGGVISATVAAGALPPVLATTNAAVVEFGDAGKETAQRLSEMERAMRDTEYAASAAAFAFQQFLGALDEEEEISAMEQTMANLRQELAETGAISDSTRLSAERMFTSFLDHGNLLAAKAYKIAVDTEDLDAAEAQILRIQQAAAAGAKFDVVTQMYTGGTADTFEGRAIRDKLTNFTRNGGPG